MKYKYDNDWSVEVFLQKNLGFSRTRLEERKAVHVWLQHLLQNNPGKVIILKSSKRKS